MCETESYCKCLKQDRELLICCLTDDLDMQMTAPTMRHTAVPRQRGKKVVRSGKGSHGLTVIKCLIEDEELFFAKMAIIFQGLSLLPSSKEPTILLTVCCYRNVQPILTFSGKTYNI